MIIRLSHDAPPSLTDLDRFDRLHAESPGDPAAMRTGPLCTVDDDGAHVWLDIVTARAEGRHAGGDGFVTGFDAMVGLATAKGWTNDAGTHVRAHVERV
jgi:hypothetical protein